MVHAYGTGDNSTWHRAVSYNLVVMIAEAVASDDPAALVFRQHGLALPRYRDYREFEILERGIPWSPSEHVWGGVGNAGELSKGLKGGREDRIREGHSDVVWSAHVGIFEHEQDLSEVQRQYRSSHARYLPIVGDIAELRAELLENSIGGLRYAKALEGGRTLPDAENQFLNYQAKLLCLADLCLVAANERYGFNIHPEENFKASMNVLTVRVPLQIVYARLREGQIDRKQARAEADALAHRGTELGIGEAALAAIWKKAPTRVKRATSRPFKLPES